MDNKIIVSILNRDYPLKVRGEEEEKQTKEFAEYVDEKLVSIQQGLGSVSEMTVAVIGALSLGEELFEARRKIENLEKELSSMSEQKPVVAASSEAKEEIQNSIKDLSTQIQSVLENGN